VHDEPKRLAAVMPAGASVSEDLAELILDCIHKDADARPVDANEIVERLIDAVPRGAVPLAGASAARRRARGGGGGAGDHAGELAAAAASTGAAGAGGDAARRGRSGG
jgi:hypothetical protein